MFVRKISVIGICVVLLGVMGCGCIGGEDANAAIHAISFTDKSGMASVMVGISGNADVDVVVEKDNMELSYESVPKRRFSEDGTTIVYLAICDDKYQTPSGGTYNIMIYSDDNLIASESTYKMSPTLKITDFNPGYSGDFMDNMSVSFKNIGELPAYVTSIYFEGCNDIFSKDVETNAQCIMPGQATTLSGTVWMDTYVEKQGLQPFYTSIRNCTLDIYLLDSEGYALNESYNIYV